MPNTRCWYFMKPPSAGPGGTRRAADVGFHGNSHMLMQDKNSLEVADWLLAWIDRNIEHQRPN